MINVVDVKHKLIFESQIQLFYVSLRMYKQNSVSFVSKGDIQGLVPIMEMLGSLCNRTAKCLCVKDNFFKVIRH